MRNVWIVDFQATVNSKKWPEDKSSYNLEAKQNISERQSHVLQKPTREPKFDVLKDELDH